MATSGNECPGVCRGRQDGARHEEVALQQPLTSFEPRHQFFVGVDSDGCAFDAMEIKHSECFTPATIRVWGLQAISRAARETALFVNLYSSNRGLNRWQALDRFFDLLRERPEPAARGVEVPSGENLKAFLASGCALSAQGVRDFLVENPSAELETGLIWDAEVNQRISEMVTGVPPFPGVDEALGEMGAQADLVVISATPYEALEREWGEHGLARHMSAIAGQEAGTKAQQVLAATGDRYASERILLVGDAPGDLAAATSVGCLFFPINPGAEEQSWQRLREESFQRFLDGTFAGAHQDELVADFSTRLRDTPPWSTT